MGRYIIKRILTMIVIIIIAAFVGFTLMYVVPGDPARNLLGNDATAELLAAKRAELGIDKPYLVQLGTYFYNTFIRFDLGTSWVYKTPVVEALAERLPRTLIIGAGGMLLNVVVGTLLGIFAATHQGKLGDSITMILAMAFVSFPDFWVALMAILLFSSTLNWLPAFGIDSWKCYILPILCSSLGGIAVNARQSRSAMLETIRADFVTTARAKGQLEKVVVRRHMLPNAMMPIITGVGGGLAHIVAGSPVMETVFSIPGVGQYMLMGVNVQDRPIVCACIVFFAAFTSVAILVMDLCYAFLDPRIKAQYASKKRKKTKEAIA
ncbi:MAG: ABC transporter permease [Lachnospiraceae bacterium]|nr:ABC transporter permease [Lachnospiraceae bacterium]